MQVVFLNTFEKVGQEDGAASKRSCRFANKTAYGRSFGRIPRGNATGSTQFGSKAAPGKR